MRSGQAWLGDRRARSASGVSVAVTVPDQSFCNAPVHAEVCHDYGFAAFLCCSSHHACSRAAASGGKISGGKSEASNTWRTSITSSSAKGTREAHSIASVFDFTRMIQKPASSSFV